MTDPSLPPDNDLLRRFLLGELAGPDLERVAAYLDRHPEVASTLNALAVRDTLLDALRAGSRAPADPPELSALIGRLTHLGATPDPPPTPEPADVPTADLVVGADVPYDLAGVLAPAEGAGEIGRLGKYRVTHILGRGGMGVVFAAVDTKLKRNVALKVMLPGLAASPPARQRFLREAENAARVEHDNIVPIYDIAEDRGIPFLAMPLLVGETLDARLRGRGPLATADVLVVGRQVAEGLAAAHAAGLIHRDVKPSNVWLERGPAGAFRRARILDFGLARPVRGSGGDQDITHTGTIMGTPAYMAPEQARGAAVDHRADLFSLGCVLYQMATGRRPFQGADPFAILTALAVDHPPAPAEVNPHCPPALSALVLGLLAKGPADRWPATAQQVADELARTALDSDATAPVTHTAPQPKDVWSEVADSATEADAVPTVGLAEPAAPPRPRPARGRGRGPLWAAAALLVAALGLAGYLYGTQIVRVVTDKGELVIDVDDPNIEVKVVRGDAVIVDRTTGREFVLRAGDGEVTFHDPHSGAEAVTKTFRITRGGKAVVSASMVELRRKNGGKPGEAKPRADTDEPRLPVAGAEPARNAFPGRLTYHDTFDDAEGCELHLLETAGVRRRVEDSRYKVILAAGKANEFTSVEIGPGAAAGAFAVRARAENATWSINFRFRGEGLHGEWLGFVLTPDGRWALRLFGQRENAGKLEQFVVRIVAIAPDPDPALKEGRFVAVAGRWVGNDYAVWVNGREVVSGRLPDKPEPGWVHDPFAIQVCLRVIRDGPAKLELAYAAVWDLSGPAPPAGGPKPGPKE